MIENTLSLGLRVTRGCLLAGLFALLPACVGTTGGSLVDFSASASGPPGTSGSPGAKHAFEFDLTETSGYHVTLTQATLQIGAVYLDATPCLGSSAPTTCGDPSVTAVAQVNGGVVGAYGVGLVSGVDVDVLSPDPQPFNSQGSGIDDPGMPAQSAQVWLSGGTTGMAIYADPDSTTIASVAGTAEKDGKSYRFIGTVTISSSNRGKPGTAAQPGVDPLCLQRIASPICLGAPITPVASASLHVEVDPRPWFNNVDFSQLPRSGDADSPYQIPDTNADPNGANLLQGIEASSGVYSFSFETP
jgi:hypothetical protein